MPLDEVVFADTGGENVWIQYRTDAKGLDWITDFYGHRQLSVCLQQGCRLAIALDHDRASAHWFLAGTFNTLAKALDSLPACPANLGGAS